MTRKLVIQESIIIYDCRALIISVRSPEHCSVKRNLTVLLDLLIMRNLHTTEQYRKTFFVPR